MYIRHSNVSVPAGSGVTIMYQTYWPIYLRFNVRY